MDKIDGPPDIERQALNYMWKNNRSVPQAVEACVHDLIAATTIKQPEALAITAWDGQMTYRELDVLSTRLAERLTALGVGPEVVVPLLFEKSKWMPLSMLAVMKAGGASVAIDVTQPDQRLLSILQQVNGPVVLSSVTTEAKAARVISAAKEVVVPEILLAALNFERKHDDTETARPSTTLMLFFTSGSTGTPKGAVISHSNFASMISIFAPILQIFPGQIVYDFVSYSFDIAWFNVLATLASGACLYIPSESERNNDLGNSIRRSHATVLVITPSIARLLQPADLPDILSISLAGEPTKWSDYERWSSDIHRFSFYGPAEGTVITIAGHARMMRSQDYLIATGNDDALGHNLWFVDPSNHNVLAPPGMTAELWLEGPLVAQGYYADDQKTATAFVEDPSWLLHGSLGNPGRHGRLYRTGDLVRYEFDGSITFVGRKDAQVKIRGQRFELGDVEHHVQACLDDADAVDVVAEVVSPSQYNDTLLVAFIISHRFKDCTTEQTSCTLQKFLSGLEERLSFVLPVYMVPTLFLGLEPEAIPITTTGKLDRRALRVMGTSMAQELFDEQKERRQPTTDFEHRLQQLWASVLSIDNISHIGLDDSFLQVGGDSIQAMRLVGMARKQGLSLAVADIFAYPRLQDLARVTRPLVQEMQRDGQDPITPFSLLKSSINVAEARKIVSVVCGIAESQIEDIYPCTPIQEGLLALTSQQMGQYAGRRVLELRSSVDFSALHAALEKVYSATSILRTRIVELAGRGLMQVVVDENLGPIPEVPYDGLRTRTQVDTKTTMRLGTSLSYFAIAHDFSSGRRYLVWTIHHALYDGFTVPQILELLEKSYSNHTIKPSTPFQHFVEYVSRVNSTLAATSWQQRFENLQTQIYPALPSSTYKPQADSSIIHEVRGLEWPKNGFTPSTAVRAALSILTAIYTDSDDVVFGVTVTGRQVPVPGIEEIIGPTIATRPVRTVLDWQKTVISLLQQVQIEAVEMIPLEHVGLHRIRRMNLDTSHACQFQTLLVVQPVDDNCRGDSRLFVEENCGIDTTMEGVGTSETYALMLECYIHAQGMRLNTVFDSTVIQHQQAQNMAQQFEHVLRKICDSKNGSKRLVEIKTLSRYDLHQIWSWNRMVPETFGLCMHDIIAETTQKQPDATAICAWDGVLAYCELDNLSTDLAHRLASLGVKPGVIVPLCFEKSMWTAVAMVAVMKSGGASVLMDTAAQPHDRLRMILEQVNPVLILTSLSNHKLVRKLWGGPLMKVNYDTFRENPLLVKPSLPIVQPSDIVCVVFTSGSTGTPKGVLLTHTNISSAIHHQRGLHGVHASSRVYDFASYIFDAAWSNFLQALTSGACLCVPSSEDRINDLAGSIRRFAATYADLTPSTVRALPTASLRDLTTLVIGGESFSADEAKMWSELVQLKNIYGPSECTSTSTIADLAPDAVFPNSIGRGVGLNTWVVNQDTGGLAVVGGVGELLLEGPLVGPGYLLNSEKTAECFVEDPEWLLRGGPPEFSGRRGRLYKTGDLVRYNSDGSLAFIGRRDTQVKIRGQRVELGDVSFHVQASISHSIGAKITVVAEVGMPKGRHDLVLVAFVASSDFEDMTQQDMVLRIARMTDGIEERLNRRVPVYMIPAAFIPLKKIPVTATGKLDRRSLHDICRSLTIEQLGPTQSEERREPQHDLEFRLRQLWARILEINEFTIGADDSFLRIGGDSVTAMRLVGLARQSGLLFTVKDVFQRPQLFDLASVAQQKSEDEDMAEIIKPFSLLRETTDVDLSQVRKDAAALCGVEPSQIEDVYPCTPLQEGLLALTTKRAGDYIERQSLRLFPTVDTQQFRQAWAEVVATTPILRTRIIDLANYGLVQVVVSEVVEELPSEWPSKESSFGLGTPLARFGLVGETNDQQWSFIYMMHHAIYDAWSLSMMLEKLEYVYSGRAFPASTPFQSFVRYVTELDEKQGADFWRDQLSASEAPVFPALPSASYLPRADTAIDCSFKSLQWPSDGITASTVVRTAWSLLVSCYTDSDDVAFGATVTGRQAAVAGLEDMLGPTIATVPVRITINWDGISLDHLLHEVQAQAIEMTPFEQMGLQRIRRVSASAANVCDFQTLVVVQPAEKSGNEQNRLFVYNDESGLPDSTTDSVGSFETYALMVECQLLQDGLRVQIVFDSAVIEAAQVRGLSLQFEHVLRTICKLQNQRVETTLADLDLVSTHDLCTVWGWNASVPKTASECVHELIMATTRKQPDASAICAWDGQLTYQELDDLSTDLARHLMVRIRAFGRDSITALCFEKSKWTPVAMLAVMKAGGASVAIDVAQPVARLRRIIQQSGPRLIICSAAGEELAYELRKAFVCNTGKHPEVIVLDRRCLKQVRLSPEQALQPLPTVQPSDRLYITFTSGSTGTPKGVVITHSNFSSAIYHQSAIHGMDSEARVFDFTSYAFDVSWSNVLQTLARGGCLCIPSDTDRRNDLAGALQRFHATYADLTPSTVRVLPLETIQRLNTLVIGGEPVSVEDVRLWASLVDLKNTYGPSECTPTATLVTLDPKATSTGNIGHGLGLNAWVADSSTVDMLAPIGAVGELLLEGPLVGPGYLADDAKTAAAFIVDPPWLLKGAPGHLGRSGRIYKTGDLVHYNIDGSLTYVGRKDAQVKIRGQRVELGEIETHLGRYSPIRHAVCLFPRSGPCADKLVAVLSLEEFKREAQLEASICPLTGEKMRGIKHHAEKLETLLQEFLPSYMVPSVWIVLEDLPLNTSGKLNRRELNTWLCNVDSTALARFSGNEDESNPREPANKTERTLQELCAQVLNIPAARVDLQRSFIANGGDSIAAMRLIPRCHATNLFFQVATLLRCKTLADVAKVSSATVPTTQAQQEDADMPVDYRQFLDLGNDEFDQLRDLILPQIEAINGSALEAVFPCSPAVEGMIHSQIKHPGVYNTSQIYGVGISDSQSVDLERFVDAWQKVVARQPSLRSVFFEGKDKTSAFCQAVLKSYRGEVIILEKPDETAALEAFGQLPMLDARHLVPPHRLAVCRLSDEDQIICQIELSHAITDDVSNNIILREWKKAYLGILDSASLLSTSKTFVRTMRLTPMEQKLAFWRKKLANVKPCHFPVPYAATQKRSGDCLVGLRMDGEILHDIKHFCMAESVTPASIFTIAWAVVLAAYTGTDSACFGYLASGRGLPIPGIEDSVGAYITMLIHSISISKSSSVQDLVRRVYEEALEDLEFQHCSLAAIQSELGLLSGMGLFNTMVSFQPLIHSDADITQQKGGLIFEQREGQGHSEYEMMFSIDYGDAFIDCALEYWRSSLTESQAQRILSQVKACVAEIVQRHSRFDTRASCDAISTGYVIADLKITCAEDLCDIWKWNAVVPETDETSMHELLAEAFRTTSPEAIAVSAWDGELSYSQLDALSTKLAHHLIERGVDANVNIPLCFEKSLWTPVAMLAVTKAGGASVALDATQPEGRLRTIVQQVDPILVLSSTRSQRLASSICSCLVIVIDTVLLDRLPHVTRALPAVAPSSRLYINFTSGSTGTPKGASIIHSNMTSALRYQRDSYGISPSSRVYDFASYAFDAAWSNFFLALMQGACLCVPSDTERKGDLAGSLHRFQATYVNLTTSVARTLPLATMENLDTLVLLGEFVSLEDIKLWARVVQVKNMYGPCECTPVSTIASFGPHTTLSTSSSIGRGVGLNTWIVDPGADALLTPVGGIGELLLEGPLVGPGYLADPLRSAEAFVIDPPWLLRGGPQCPGRPGRLYKTGDLVSYNPDGSLVYHGRKDDVQVKIRGQRIELGEIEYHIRAYFPDTADNNTVTVEIVKPSGSTSSLLVAFFAPRTAPKEQLRKSVAGIETYLTARLPAYMLPSMYIEIETMMATVTGKTDRRKLRDFGGSFTLEQLTEQDMSRTARREPATSIERRLLEIWASVLGIETSTIGLDDNFLRVGGDSIRVMMMMRRINVEFNVRMSIEQFLQHTRLSGLAEEVSRLQSGLPGRGAKLDAQMMKDISDLPEQVDISLDHDPIIVSSRPHRRVFLTGATGYLGTALLHRLLQQDHIMEVSVLVRARSFAHGKERIIAAATFAGWWHEEYADRVAVWLGDLRKPQLGLSTDQWRKLSGTARSTDCIDGIVHSGARVDWFSDYAALRDANVLSTHQLLQLCGTGNHHLKRLVFIAAFQPGFDGEIGEDAAIHVAMEGSGGYAQTKLVAEQVLRRTAARKGFPGHRLAVTIPAFIVGDKVRGFANTDDYVWRVVAGCISIGSWPREPDGSWVYFSTYTNVAASVIESLVGVNTQNLSVNRIGSGLPIRRFWRAVSAALPAPLQERSATEWQDEMEAKIGEVGHGHPIYPVLALIDPQSRAIGTRLTYTEDWQDVNEELEAAVTGNVRYLLELGYFSEKWPLVSSDEAVFRRGIASEVM